MNKNHRGLTVAIEMARTPKKPHPMLTIWRKRFGDWIRQRRELSGHSSQDGFGEFTRLSRTTVNIIENGTRSYGIDEGLTALMYAEAKTEVDAERLDPIRTILAAIKGINALTAEEIQACYTVIEALNGKNRVLAQNFLGILRGEVLEADSIGRHKKVQSSGGP